MKRSYILLSLIVSQALCATDVTADFSGTNGGTSADGKLKPSSVTKPSSGGDATLNTDWSGSDSYLNVMTDGLTFEFTDSTNNNLIIKNGFDFTNKIPQNDASNPTPANITITKKNGNLTTLTIGSSSSTSSYDYVTLGSNINLKITEFTSVNIKNILSIASGSTFDTSSIDNFTNDGGIILEGSSSTLKVKSTLTNNGTILMKEGSKIESIQDLKVDTSATKQGSIIVQGNAEISSGNANLTITNQDITIQNIVSKNDDKVNVAKSTLTLKSNASGTLTLGDTDKVVNIIGKIGNTDPSKILDSEIPSGSEIGNLALDGFTTIEAKNVNFKNVNVTSKNATSINLDSGNLGLENTTINLSTSSSISATNDSTITLVEQNAISSTGTLTITGSHDFKGNGSLDLVGSSIVLGNGTSSVFNATGNGDATKIGVSAKNGIVTNEFTLTNLTLQAINSTIINTKMTLTNSTIVAIDSEENLADLNITKDSATGTIEVSNGMSATLRGQNISITEQTINLANSGGQKTSLTLQAESGGVTLDGGTNGLSISGKNSMITNNIFNLNTPLLTLKGKVILDNLTVNANEDLRIVGTEFDDTKGLLFTNGTTIIAGSTIGSGIQYHSLTFTSDFDGVKDATDESQAYVSFNADTKLEASDFTFQNQNIQLTNQQSGVTLSLYAYGTGIVDSSSSPTYSDSGVFVMNNTTFTDGTGSTIKFFSGSGGSTLLPSNLTLNKVSLMSCSISSGPSCSTANNALDLSTTEGSINILNTSTISATKFVYKYAENGVQQEAQGIGVDLFVGQTVDGSSPQSTSGSLTIKSIGTTSDSKFILGGELALDLRAGGTTFDIEMGNGTPNKLSSNTIDLIFRGGGLTVIGGGTTNNTHTFKAKSFTFMEVKGSDGVVVDSPFVKVKNAELTLEGDTNMTTVDLVGTVYLEGATTGNNGISKLKAIGNTSGVTLNLHDIEVVGNSAIQDNELSFENSNITVSSSGNKGFSIIDKNTTLTDNTLEGTINSIALNSGILSFQYNTNTKASITLNADSTITSSGASTLTLNTIKVGKDSSNNDGLYSLNVTDGTFTLQEATAGNQLGAITLGSESSQGGNGGNFLYQNGSSAYNALTLKGNLTSYGNSSITANSFTISAKDADNSENYTISSTDGELKLIAQDTKTPALTATADITLNNGSLGYYGSSNTLASLSLDSSSSISSVGDSALQANALNVNGASISASEGTLTLKGISSSTTAGDVVVGNAGVLTLQNTNTKLATLKIQDSKSLTLSADVGYITPSNPLGDGEFGQVNVQSLLFESKSGSLINIALNSSSSTSSYSDSLFALREGAKVLITTEDGIKKKETNASYTDITLSDITTDTSGLTSITLTPLLQAGKDQSGKDIVQKLLLDLRVSQTNVTQLIESIKDANAKESMTSIVNSGNNALILESIMQSEGNAFKVGMAEYISNGNVAVVQTALDYINGAMTSLSDSMFASNKIYELIAMLKSANVENRMVRAKNPFMAKTQLASLVKSLVGTAYASSDDSLLLEEESSTPNYGEIWASFDGAMSFSQEESGNSSLYGFSAGYDTLVGEKKNYLLGFYASYGYGAYSVNYARNNSHNFGLGFYTRMSFENSEVDLILSQTVGLNHTDIDLGASNSYAAQMLKQTLAYNFYTTDIEARYGYVFKVGSEDSPYYFRPFGGINFALIVNSGARGDGAAELGIEAMNTYQLSVSVGVEMRKYFGDENYLYLLPVLQKGLLNDGAGANVGFYGAENIKVTPAYNVDTTMAVYLGGQGSIGENLAVNGGVGVKVGFEKKDLLTNWNVGLRYKF